VLGHLDVDKNESRVLTSRVAEKIRTSLCQPYLLTDKREGSTAGTVEHHCTASIGATLFFGQEESEDEILKRADMAMYDAKQAGRNAIRFRESKS